MCLSRASPSGRLAACLLLPLAAWMLLWLLGGPGKLRMRVTTGRAELMVLQLLCFVASNAVCAATAASASAAAAAAPRCTEATATTLLVSWGAEDATDMYYVALAKDAASRPLALQTCAVPSLKLVDLVPGTSYWITVRSHPSE
jgi:hypothetical protein